MTRLLVRATAAALLATMCQVAPSKDLGVQGNVWPIIEVDIRQLMLEDAAKANWSKVQEEVQDKAKSYLDRLPKRHLPNVDVTKTEWFDPSIELQSDIQAPVRLQDGSFAWQVLARKGTRVNPLHKIRPTQALFFYDGGSDEQLKLVKKLAVKEPERLMFIEAGTGSVKDVSESLNLPIYHANDAMLQRFQVVYLPSMVYPGAGEKGDYLGVTAFAFPYNLEEVLLTWEDFNYKPTEPSNSKQEKGGQ